MELKKNPTLDYRRKYALFFNIGLVISLLIVISAFEWKSVESVSWVDLPEPVIFEDPVIPPITDITPKKPKVQLVKFVEIKDDIEVAEPKVEGVIVTGEIDVPDLPDDIFEEAPIEVPR